ncbi:helix-turn-helix domain-containing protein [Streptomyces sp. NPDC000927]|uniref:helix-turn-helix domain-containing protein n=1 Tax=Streptomyces sp. NPDC000927 TaxID=3154371 RepID=UPI00332C9FFE
MSDEEVRQVSQALDAVEQIADLEARVRAKSQVMAEQVKRNKTWQKERRDLVFDLKAEGLSYRKIAERVGTSLATVQDILRGYSGSGSHRPRKGDTEK